MRARLLYREKETDLGGNIWEVVLWMVPADARHPEGIRYRLAFVPRGSRAPAVLYDNHHPKGHHRHFGDDEFPYEFASIERLFEDFHLDIERWTRLRTG